jgi:hypothetical protein
MWLIKLHKSKDKKKVAQIDNLVGCHNKIFEKINLKFHRKLDKMTSIFLTNKTLDINNIKE